MHCTLCGLHFSWRQAIPCNMAALENTGDGRFRLCPNCQYQNDKLHNLSQARCARCQRDFNWEEASFVPVVVFRRPPPPRNASRPSDECGGAREPPPTISPVLLEWLSDARRAAITTENMDDVTVSIPTGCSDEEPVIHESLRCEICSLRAKTFALQCGHLFCENCLVLSLRNNPVCPVDRSHVVTPPIRVYF